MRRAHLFMGLFFDLPLNMQAQEGRKGMYIMCIIIIITNMLPVGEQQRPPAKKTYLHT